jgi:hypothetical protein
VSAANSIARGAREPEAQAKPGALDIPPELEGRYEIRLVEAEGGEQRIGLFRPGDRATPAIEITADRSVARREDAETVDSLVKIARHNGWDRIDVDGSPEFRKAIWTAATHAGLEVSGYEPTFVEREEAEAARRDPRSGDGPATALATPPLSAEPSPPSVRPDTVTAASVRETGELSDGDSRLLLRISALTDDRQRLVETLEMDMPRLAREVQVERVGENRDALVTALDRALESPSLAESFDRAGYGAEDLRGMATANEWEGGIADAIYLVRTGLHRDTMRQDRLEVRSTAELASEPRALSGIPGGSDRGPASGAAAPSPAEAPDRSARERPAGGEELAELFLHGSPERVAADPRLSGAVDAQTVMEQHIGEVFGGDATRQASANLESRQLISDALRRGLDVAVREPTPVRQIEPVEVRPDLER